MSGRKRSDVVGEEMGKMLLKGYRMLASSCERCDCVIMQDKEGNDICVNCNLDKKEAIAAASASGDVKPQGQVSGQQNSTSAAVSPENQKSNNIALDMHKEQAEKVQREAELTLLKEIKDSCSVFDVHSCTTADERRDAVSRIRDCASAFNAVHNMFTK